MAMALWLIDFDEDEDEKPNMKFSPAVEDDTSKEWLGVDEEED